MFRRLTGLPDEAILGRRPSETGFGVDAALIERVLARQVIAGAFRWSTCTWSRPSPSAPAQASWRFRRVAVRDAVTTAKIVYKVGERRARPGCAHGLVGAKAARSAVACRASLACRLQGRLDKPGVMCGVMAIRHAGDLSSFDVFGGGWRGHLAGGLRRGGTHLDLASRA